jgi:ornithine decarboxylase
MENIPTETITDIYNYLSDKNVKIFDIKLGQFDIINQYLEKKKGEESFVLVDLGDIIRQYYRWEKNLPRVIPYYAIKCNPCPIIIELLNKLGCCFDCASQQEILKIINLNIEPQKIIFANPCKPVDYIKFSRSYNVNLLVVDSCCELLKIKLYHPEAKILIRIQVDDSKSLCKFNCKFGVELENDKEILDILEMSKILNLNIIGVSFHVGSGCEDAHVYWTALSDCKKVFDIASSLDIKMNLIDIGGGFPGIIQSKVSFESMAESINKGIDEIFAGGVGIKFIAEPGRYFVTSSHTLVCSIINKKEKINKKTGEKLITYYLSDGVYKSFSNTIFDYAKPVFITLNKHDKNTFQCILYGESCDSLDIISKECQLPSLAIGESIVVQNMGSYTLASASEFNGFTKPELYYIIT